MRWGMGCASIRGRERGSSGRCPPSLHCASLATAARLCSFARRVTVSTIVGTSLLELASLLVSSAALTLCNQEIFPLCLPALECCNHPERHAAAAGPGITSAVAIFHGGLAALATAITLPSPKELI